MRRGLAVLAALALSGCGPTTSAHTSDPVVHSSPHPAAVTHLVVRALPWRLPGPIAREAVSGDGGTTVTVAGGLLPGDGSTTSAYDLDLATGAVHRLPRLAVPVHDTAGWRLGHRPVVIGGGNAVEQDVVQVLDGTAWQVAGHLPGARSDLVAVGVDGRAWVLGGYDGVRPAESAILRSSDGVHWQRVGRLPVPVRYPAVALVRGAILLFGGEVDHVMQTAVQRIDLATGRARVVAHLPVGLGHASALVLDGRVLVAGGRTGSDTLTSRTWWFSAGRFRAGPRLPRPRADAASYQSGARGWLIGGETPAETDRVLLLRMARS